MKKILFIVLSIILLLASCGNSKIKPSSIKQTDNKRAATDNNSKNSPLTMIFDNGNHGSGNSKGYYYIPNDCKNDTSGCAYNNIMYMDYATKQEIYLCNKPNCLHNTDSCTSYINLKDGFQPPFIFTFGDKVYLIYTETGKSGMISNISGTNTLTNVNGKPSLTVSEPKLLAPVIYQMNLDGSNKTQLYTAESGYALCGPYLINNHNLYAISNKMEMIKKGDGHYSVKVTKSYLISINLLSKKVSTVAQVEDQTIIGAYGNTIVLSKTQLERELTDEEKTNTSYYLDELKKAKAVFSTLDISSGIIKEHGSIPYTDTQNLVVNKNRIFYSASNDNKIQFFDLDTDKSGILADKLSPSISNFSNSIHDGMLIYEHWIGRNNDSKIESYYSVDCKTGKIEPINLFTSGDKQPLWILAETSDSFLVLNGFDTKNKYYAFAGVTQTDIVGYHYALIKKSDFYSGKAIYTSIKKAQ